MRELRLPTRECSVAEGAGWLNRRLLAAAPGSERSVDSLAK